MLKIDTIILAGGLGTRLIGILEKGEPKALAIISGKPFLHYQLEFLRGIGASRFIFALGYGASKIEKFLTSLKKENVEIIISKERGALGTGGAIKRALSLVRSDPVLVINGDTLVDIDYDVFLERHLCCRAMISIALTEVDDVSRYGDVMTDDRDRVISFNEKSGIIKPGKISAGVYLINKKYYEKIEKVKFSIEKDIFPQLINSELYAFNVGKKFIDIGTPQSLNEAAAYLSRGLSQ